MDEKNSFLDKNTLLAIGLSVVFFIGWQAYIQKKYPNLNKKQKVINEAEKKNFTQIQSPKRKSGFKTKTLLETREKPNSLSEEKLWTVSTPKFNFRLSSSGMGITHFELNKYSDRKNRKIEFNNGNTDFGNFATLFEGQVVNFSVEQISEDRFVGKAKKNGYQFKKEMLFNRKNYTIDVKLDVQSPERSKALSVQTLLSNKILDVKTSFLTPSYEGTEFFTISRGSGERERVNAREEMKQQYEKTGLASIGSLYFSIALKDMSDFMPETSIHYKPRQKVALASVMHQIKGMGVISEIRYQGFMGPKKYDVLKQLDQDFVKMINYGIFSLLSKPILKLLKVLYGVLKNWGLAIILLTVFIRLLLLPINISSMRSMKKVQKIQPQIAAIKEKYKDDPKRINQETMALMKREKANPLGGCLPMLLQLPVFFALYSVLGQSIELYKSPFVFWIQDLSYKDPFFILPISVGVLYFIQMSFSPQPADPTQAKMMKMMPALFCFFMITVPSGLTLYFLINTIFGIGQQFLFQREKTKTTT